jgi:hypothetical protein
LELLKKQLFKKISEEEMEHSAVARQLIDNILDANIDDANIDTATDNNMNTDANRDTDSEISGNGAHRPTRRYPLKAALDFPLIGIGAPIAYFLPQAGKLLNADVIIPTDADVANALGAITSHILIKQKLVIRIGNKGNYVVEGVAGNRSFSEISEAQAWAVAYLKESVRSQALKAGTSRKTVEMESDDRVVDTGSGVTVFLGRTITATLQGNPDLVLAEATSTSVSVVESDAPSVTVSEKLVQSSVESTSSDTFDVPKDLEPLTV